MFLTSTFKKFKHEQTINKINQERDQAFNSIVFETALKDAALYLKTGKPLPCAMLTNLIKRLCVGLPVGDHYIQGNVYKVTSDSNGLKSVTIENNL